MLGKHYVFVALLLLGLGLYLGLDLQSYISLDYFNQQKQLIFATYEREPLWVASLFFVLYVVSAGLSIPGAGTIMTLAAGAIFGFTWGLILASFASSLGALMAFLVARYLLRDWVQRRFATALAGINKGIEQDGLYYLLTLRLVPLFPFFIVNALMGLTRIRSFTFYWVSQLGMLLGTAVYVNAGMQLVKVDQLGDVMSLPLLLSFLLLGFVPLLSRKLLEIIVARRALAGWTRPQHFDANLIVIGAGSAGLVASLIAATVKARVILIEKQAMGGDCLNTGCVPSKALIRSARMADYYRRADEFGLANGGLQVNFKSVMARVRRIIAAIEPHDSISRYTSLGVEVIIGSARLVSPWEVEVNGQTLAARKIIVATGAHPSVPPIRGLKDYLTSDTLWQLDACPERLVVLGGGPIGCEMAQSFSRLGSRVTLIEMLPRVLMREDSEVSEQVESGLRNAGVELLLQHRALEVIEEEGQQLLVCEAQGSRITVAYDRLLVALGRQANTDGFGLRELGVAINDDSSIRVDKFMRSSVPTIYACGDVAGPYQFTHTASHQAWYATVNALFGQLKKFRVDYRVIPWATFTDPEVARVGLNEQDALEQGLEYDLSLFDLSELDRAIADGEASGFIKVLTVPGRDRILGVTIVGYHASELIAEFILAMKHGIGLNKVLGTIHIYPTLAEANKYVAGVWKRNNAPLRVLNWLQRYHQWRL